MDSLLKQLIEDVVKNPKDPTYRSIVGDWLEDSGKHEEAEAWYWMARTDRMPFNYAPDGNNFGSWFDAKTVAKELDVLGTESNIAQPVFQKLTKGKSVARHRKYDTRQEALLDLAEAYIAAKKAGWQEGEGERELVAASSSDSI